MATRACRIGLALLLASCAAAGCGGGESDDHADAHPAPKTKVPCPKSTPEFVATPSGGLEAMGTNERIAAKLIDSDWPEPYKGDNEWTVLFRDADGQPLDDIEVTKAESYMPVHDHPGEHPPVWSKLDEPGLVLFEAVNLFMGGPWEVTFEVESEAAGGEDEMKFYVCVKDD